MDMDVLELLTPVIPADEKACGEHGSGSDAIQIVESKPTYIAAQTIRGESFYVTMRVDEDGDLIVSCACDAYEELGYCEHIWAMALAMKQRGHALQVQPGRKSGVYAAFDFDDEPGGGVYDVMDATLEAMRSLARGNAWQEPWREPWDEQLERIEQQSAELAPEPWRSATAPGARILYALDLPATSRTGSITFTTWYQKRLKSGVLGRAFRLDPRSARARDLATDEDHGLLDLLAPKAERPATRWGWPTGQAEPPKRSGPAVVRLIRRLLASGRFCQDQGDGPEEPALSFEDGPPFVLGLRLEAASSPKSIQVSGFLQRGDERIALDEADLLIRDGLMLLRHKVIPFDDRGAMTWVHTLFGEGPFQVPVSERKRVLEALLNLPLAPILEIDGEPAPRAVRPRPHLLVEQPVAGQGRSRGLPCQIFFDYAGSLVAPEDRRGHLVPGGGDALIRRDLKREEEALARFSEAGGRPPTSHGVETECHVAASRLSGLVSALVAAGWSVEAEGVRYRQAQSFQLSVSSGIDWFDLKGEMAFDGQVVALPALLEAARRGAGSVELGDGSKGMLPEKWLAGWEIAAALGAAQEDSLRFHGNQGWVLDALLAGRDEVAVDHGFETMRKRFAAFRGIRPARQPRGFVGTLRTYQREGLAWLRFLLDMGLGGCLADDMGLGKTVQVLALLEGRRAARTKHAPTLVVVPRSLIFNWLEEAQRFTPKLRLLDYTGPGRKKLRERFAAHDVILTTYGTLCRDILALKDIAFGLVILDESQAIKNARSQSAKAARLLQAEHRLALSGTPIENHLGELWSLFEFLNPGMLGRAKAFQGFAGGANGRTLDEEARARLSSAIQPFLLRRTKEQVLPDLPARTDQVLHCEMKAAQRRDYEKIREHFRTSLLARAEGESLGGMKLHVLEALLRLRQAACHPALLDPTRKGEPSAKLDALLPMLEEVVEGGHKALVFSQFTKFLGVLREHLDSRKLPYEYLDGRTRDRQARVERFQNEADCRIFLISLKAGGLGLNLTAADYVFILDPWWNPAVERQAVDRAHRIGQKRPVMSYRLICSDTVEEKVLSLQAEKRELADALLAADAGLIKRLTREDLELLLS